MIKLLRQNTSMINEKNEREIVCARSGLLRYKMENCELIHYFEKLDDNKCILKSRYWIGNKITFDDSVPVPLRWILQSLSSFKFMKRWVPREVGPILLKHCAEEMANLATFLPELYNLYHM